MKEILKAFTLILILAISSKSTAQVTNHGAHLNIEYGQGVIDTALFTQYSLNMEVYVNKYIGINWNFGLINRTDGINHFHAPIGIVAVILAAGGFGEKFTTFAILLSDGVSFHIPIGSKLDISPYVNFLGVDIIWKKDWDDEIFKYSVSTGIKATFIAKDRITAFSFFEARKTLGYKYSLGGGVGLGILMGNKNIGDE